jgi:hypothetical protein
VSEASFGDPPDYHPGYIGAFTKNEAPQCYRNGTRIRKTVHQEGDATPVGGRGTVLGSIFHPELGGFYFVEWDHKPKVAVGVAAVKIGLLEEETAQ